MAKDENINVKLTKEQRRVLKSLIGELGSSEPEVLRNVFIAWLSEQGIISDIIRKKGGK